MRKELAMFCTSFCRLQKKKIKVSGHQKNILRMVNRNGRQGNRFDDVHVELLYGSLFHLTFICLADQLKS